MIAPYVRIEALEPAGFAWLCDLAAQRQGRQRPWLWIRHRDGQVTGAAPAGPAADDVAGLSVTDPGASASELLERLDVARVVLIDESRVDELARCLDSVADPRLTQWEYFQASQARFWECDAVTTSPVPPRAAAGWERLASGLAGRDLEVDLVIVEGQRVLLPLRASIRGGMVTYLTSPATPATGADDLEAVLVGLDAGGAAHAVAVIPRDFVERVFLEDDLPGAFLDGVASNSVYTRGLEGLTS